MGSEMCIRDRVLNKINQYFLFSYQLYDRLRLKLYNEITQNRCGLFKELDTNAKSFVPPQ